MRSLIVYYAEFISSLVSMVCAIKLNFTFLFSLFHRQGYAEDYHKANQSAYSDHYVDYPKPYDYAGMSYLVIIYTHL